MPLSCITEKPRREVYNKLLYSLFSLEFFENFELVDVRNTSGCSSSTNISSDLSVKASKLLSGLACPNGKPSTK